MSVTLAHSTLHINHKAKRTERNSKKPRKNFIQTAAKRLLTASFIKRRTHMYDCVIASLQAHASESNTTQRGETNSEEKTPFKTQSSGCLLQALSKPSRRTLACSCLLLTAGRREKCRVVDLIIRSGRSLRCHSDNAQACN